MSTKEKITKESEMIECNSHQISNLVECVVRSYKWNKDTDAVIFIALSDNPSDNSTNAITGVCVGSGSNLDTLAEELLTNPDWRIHFQRAMVNILHEKKLDE